MEKSRYFTLSAILIATMLISMVSASTFIVGLVEDFNQNPPVGLGGQDMTITCNYNSQTETKTTTSLDDGTYGVEFSFAGCDNFIVDDIPGAKITIIKYIPESGDSNIPPVTVISSGGNSGRIFEPQINITQINSSLTETNETSEKLTTDANGKQTQGINFLTGAAITDFITSGKGIAMLAIVLVLIASGIFLFHFKKK